MPGTVYLHIGSGKTGTSAIQVALVRNRSLLLRHGLVYPESKEDSRARMGMTTTGNGEALSGVIWCGDKNPSGKVRQTRIWAANAYDAQSKQARLTEFFKDNANCSFVYSSEELGLLPPNALTLLFEIFHKSSLRVKVIYYVRHIMDHALSAHNQAVKGKVYRHSFLHFLGNYRSRFANVIENFSNVVGKSNVILRLYETERSDLVGRFLNLLLEQEGLQSLEPLILQGQQESVNRSLTPEELEIMLSINNLLRTGGHEAARRIGKRISSHITGSVRPSDYRKMVSAEEMRLIKQNHQDVLKVVNDFAAGNFELKFKSDDIVVGTRPSPTESTASTIYRAVIESLIHQINVPEKPRPKSKGSGRNLCAKPVETDEA